MFSLIALLVLLGCSAALAADVARRLRSLQRQQQRIDVALSEQRLIAQLRAQIAAGQTVAANVVSGGAETVRAVHRSIAAIPFGILESIPVTRDTTRVVRRVHDLISDGVYGGITATNKALHDVARGALNPAARPQQPTDDSEKT